MYRKILHDPLRFQDDVIGPDARSLLTGLLTRDPAQRLGNNGADEIKRHPFFAKHVDFGKLLQKKIQPPFKPSVASAIDTSNFDQVRWYRLYKNNQKTKLLYRSSLRRSHSTASFPIQTCLELSKISSQASPTTDATRTSIQQDRATLAKEPNKPGIITLAKQFFLASSMSYILLNHNYLLLVRLYPAGLLS